MIAQGSQQISGRQQIRYVCTYVQAKEAKIRGQKCKSLVWLAVAFLGQFSAQMNDVALTALRK